MNAALQRPWTLERFLAWAEEQNERYEFDGVRPVAMTGGNAGHNRATLNIHAALRPRLRGTPCSYYGPDLGVRTIGNAVRYPDALVTWTKIPDMEQLAPDVRVVFEVISPSSGRLDRVENAREYGAMRSIRHYVIVDTKSPGVLVMHRDNGDADWSATTLTIDDVLDLPEIGVRIPVTEIYEDMAFDADPTV